MIGYDSDGSARCYAADVCARFSARSIASTETGSNSNVTIGSSLLTSKSHATTLAR